MFIRCKIVNFNLSMEENFSRRKKKNFFFYKIFFVFNFFLASKHK